MGRPTVPPRSVGAKAEGPRQGWRGPSEDLLPAGTAPRPGVIRPGRDPVVVSYGRDGARSW
ncbi:hypothetical protein SVEN_1230 [Streptomyces venezuelae ATCC 10712]|uniref:Uncharacterized protein n=1 Tax=Streptomyces venezuelae (strain ATCC 10712 / CBS 650.69 / DSM 40230 / JCM 4526 / NBRC 13096 / PD 04745) TaxID=953739 RepID=F2RDX7_STRVP|nr:hypothetical protein SVEN_1230 [Streptomyces venezuelae ATCC 10712]